MKKYFLFLLMVTGPLIYSQTQLNEIQKYKQIGLVWGLMKYHHPEISKGKYDWDNVLLVLLASSEKIDSQEKMNFFLLDFIIKYNSKNTAFEKRAVDIDASKLFLKNQDYHWIDQKIFGNRLTDALNQLTNNGNIGSYYAKVSKMTKMVSFDNEKGIKNFSPENKFCRLLTLFSFWNVIEYWDINKYLTDQKWFDVLEPSIDDFLKSNSIAKYEISKLKIVSKLNDSHAMGFSNEVKDSLFKFSPSFSVKILNDSIVLNAFKNKKLSQKNGLEFGDVIYRIKNQKISTYIKGNFSDLLSASNPNYLKKWLSYNLILSNNVDSINIDILKKNGKVVNKYIKLYQNFAFDFESLEKKPKDKYFLVNSNIGYIDMEQVTDKDLNAAFKLFSNTKGVILDLRNYPKNITNADISKHLLSERKEFIKVNLPINAFPATSEYPAEAPLDFISDPFKTGTNNPDYYKGKVILLVDRNTVSKAEFIGMSVQQSPNCITIGEQTGGAPINIISYTLPDSSLESFTGYGGFYPNGENVQRNGLKLDYIINESAVNYDPKLYINKAIKIIETSK
ncbi:S41 family peptidase [Flavobacterium sp.]|uniref:S41 family peptidase n=1 Tax=Flavobacterium sp. TaxID=239 RepID=UPI00261DAAC8|nr:S41 family peptidase [Flavobacterium sp.]